MLGRVIALLHATAVPLSFAELCRGLGCDEWPGDGREHVVVNGSARRERQRLRRVLDRAEQHGFVVRDGEQLRLPGLDLA